jgi:hypothetical protein
MATMPMWAPDREDRWRQLVAAAATAAAAAGGWAKAVEEAKKGTVKRRWKKGTVNKKKDRAEPGTP